MSFELELTDPILARDPYPTYDRLRKTGPMHFDEASGRWYVFSHAEGLDVLREPTGDMRWVQGQDAKLGRDASKEQYVVAYKDFVNMKSGDDHRRVRRVLARHFRPDRVAALRADTLERAHSLVDGFRDTETVELLTSFAQELPLVTISQLLGIGDEHRHTLAELLRNFKLPFLVVPMTQEYLDTINSSMEEVVEFFGSLITERRKSPGNDLLSTLIREADQGKLTESELLANAWGLFGGGYDTTAAAILNAVVTLTNHPDQRDRLVNDWSLLPRAVEECLRFDGPGGTSLRIFETDVDIGEHSVPRGTPVFVYKMAANRDEQWLGDANRFDIGREPTQHLSFGEGVHKCLGLNLARQTIGVALEVLLTRLIGLRIVDSSIDWNLVELPLRNPQSLRVSWDNWLPRQHATSKNHQ